MSNSSSSSYMLSAYNQLVRYDTSYNTAYGNIGVIIAGKFQFFDKHCASVVGIAVDKSGMIYVSDPIQNIILKINPEGNVVIFAGKKGETGNNGNNRVIASSALFNNPGGLSCDASGNLYVADTGNNQIRLIDRYGYVSLFAGSPTGIAGFTSGIGSKARFNTPKDISVDPSGNVFVADTGNHAIRLIKSGISLVCTVAGTGISGDSYGIGVQSQLSSPHSIACDYSGNIYIFDTNNHKIKLLNRSFYVLRFSGSGVKGSYLGDALTSQYNDLKYSDVDKSGNLYVIDYDEALGSRLLKINPNGIPGVVKDFAGSTEDRHVVGVSVNASGTLFVTESVYEMEQYSSSSSSSSSIDSSSSSSSSSSSIDSSSSSSFGISSSSSSSYSSSSSSSNSSSSSSSSSNSSSSYSSKSSVSNTSSTSSATSMSSYEDESSSSSSSSICVCTDLYGRPYCYTASGFSGDMSFANFASGHTLWMGPFIDCAAIEFFATPPYPPSLGIVWQSGQWIAYVGATENCFCIYAGPFTECDPTGTYTLMQEFHDDCAVYSYPLTISISGGECPS